jgi:pimeloyl-ACP methyl ester carboxylesterase
MNATRTTLVRGDARLAVRDSGGHGPAVVLVHGLGGRQAEWRSVANLLADRFRIITYDQRGHGDSSASADYRWSTLVGDLEGLVRHFDLADVTLVGHSLGAGVALEVAGRLDDCRALALLDGALLVEPPAPDQRQRSRFRNHPANVARRLVLRRLHRGPSMPAADYLALADEYRTQTARFDQALRAVRCPTLYLLASEVESGRPGAAAHAARQATAERAVGANPLVRVAWLETGHVMIRTRPHQVAEALRQLWASG